MRFGSRLLVFLACLSTSPALAQQPAPPAVALDHVAIYVSDADRSAAFYQDLFGLEQVPAPVPFARWLTLGNGMMLHIVGGRTAAAERPRWEHVALSCPDMAALIARLDAKGIAWSDLQGRPRPQTDIRGKGVRQIFIQDPDGYWIEINDARSPAGG